MVLANIVKGTAALKARHCEDSHPPDGGRRDASSGRAWAKRFMGDDKIPQLTLDSSPRFVIFPARFCAILYI